MSTCLDDPTSNLARMFGALLRIPFQALVADIQRDVANAGYTDLRPAHFLVFQHLSSEGTRLTHLAERAQITKQSMGELVQHLVANGYMQRMPDPYDGRARIIQRTEKAWEVERIARTAIRQRVLDWRDQIGHDRFDEGHAFLTDLVSLIESDANQSTG